ncbi:phage major tail protein, TP901-1 family [Prosthecodimorpha staleyi]|uniref:Phage major tail protein, TP901-1 family n=1 Tax=Prosthecodimorpha staleyi TaxID=2840188 RepID=A0A947D1U4_9HYPH|nr:phage major tail protein, TP901-1 family [Prosthecodimorpha staleyi]MBT9289126.1 phage major tail protein, TP901-1 family [Prosthecodimorpha staleyi]
MAVQAGKDLLLKLDETATGSFVTVAGLRSRRLAFSTGTVDVTHADSPDRWRELLAGAAAKRLSVSGAGVFKDAPSDSAVRRLFFEALIRPWQIVLPNFGTLEGPFQLVSLDYAGDHEGEISWDMGLESAGAITFAAA